MIGILLAIQLRVVSSPPDLLAEGGGIGISPALCPLSFGLKSRTRVDIAHAIVPTTKF